MGTCVIKEKVALLLERSVLSCPSYLLKEDMYSIERRVAKQTQCSDWKRSTGGEGI